MVSFTKVMDSILGELGSHSETSVSFFFKPHFFLFLPISVIFHTHVKIKHSCCTFKNLMVICQFPEMFQMGAVNKTIKYFMSWFIRGWMSCPGWLLVSLSLTSSVQFSSVTQLCPTLCDPMNHSTPGLPVHHQLPEFTQIHIHQVNDAIQPSHPLSSPSPPAPKPSQHQSLFQWVNSSHEVAKVLEFQP